MGTFPQPPRLASRIRRKKFDSGTVGRVTLSIAEQLHKTRDGWAGEMAQQGKAFAAETDDL